MKIGEFEIRTSHIKPPIPTRSCDWNAWVDGWEEHGNGGYGATEAEAIEDLRQQLEDEGEI